MELIFIIVCNNYYVITIGSLSYYYHNVFIVDAYHDNY